MNKSPSRIEAALHCYDALLAHHEDQVRAILARGGVMGHALDKVIARDKRRIATAIERGRRLKSKTLLSIGVPAPAAERPMRVGEWEVAKR